MDPVTIANMALGAFGAARITSLEEADLDSDEAELCFDFFDTAMRATLEEGQPLFATGFFDLGARQASPYAGTGATFSPNVGTGITAQDTLQSVRPMVAKFQFASGLLDANGFPIPLISALGCDDGSGTFSILWERNGDFIVCEDTDKLYCKAIQLITDLNKWTPGYHLALSFYLAHLICGTITHKVSVEKEMHDKYLDQIKKARRLEGAQGAVIQQFKKVSTSLANRR